MGRVMNADAEPLDDAMESRLLPRQPGGTVLWSAGHDVRFADKGLPSITVVAPGDGAHVDIGSLGECRQQIERITPGAARVGGNGADVEADLHGCRHRRTRRQMAMCLRAASAQVMVAA